MARTKIPKLPPPPLTHTHTHTHTHTSHTAEHNSRYAKRNILFKTFHPDDDYLAPADYTTSILDAKTRKINCRNSGMTEFCTNGNYTTRSQISFVSTLHLFLVEDGFNFLYDKQHSHELFHLCVGKWVLNRLGLNTSLCSKGFCRMANIVYPE